MSDYAELVKRLRAKSRSARGRPVSRTRIRAPHFVAGLEIGVQGRCVEAAPILKWAKGKSADELRAYFKRKGWRASIINPVEHVNQL